MYLLIRPATTTIQQLKVYRTTLLWSRVAHVVRVRVTLPRRDFAFTGPHYLPRQLLYAWLREVAHKASETTGKRAKSKSFRCTTIRLSFLTIIQPFHSTRTIGFSSISLQCHGTKLKVSLIVAIPLAYGFLRLPSTLLVALYAYDKL